MLQPPPPAIDPGDGPDEVLVGRDAEVAAVAARLDALGAGPAQVLVLTGETGIGKSTLLAVIRERAAAAGHRVLSGTAVEFQADVPFVVVEDALGDALGPLADGGALAAERHTAYRAVGRALQELARERPVVLLLDDLHWADPASVELVAHLLRRRPEGPILIALAMRPAQAAPPLAAAVQRAVREGGCEELRLRPLGPDDCDRLLGPGVAPARRRQLEAISGGNPFFLRQLARAQEAPASGGPAAEGDRGLPPAVSAAVAEELRHLSHAVLTVLEGAAVAGDPFAPDLAAAAAGVPEDDALDALDALAAADLVRPAGSARRMRFRHPVIRHAVYAAAAPAWRIGAHARVAERLALRGGDLQARAHHLGRSAPAGDEGAAAVIEQAAREVMGSAPAAAARLLEEARQMLPATPATAARSLELLIVGAGAHADAGDLPRCIAMLEEAVPLLPPEAVDMRVQLIAGCAAVERLIGRHGAAESRLLAALPEAEGAAPAAAATLRVELVAGCVFQGEGFDLARGREWGLAALRDAPAGGPSLVAGAAAMMALLECASGGTAAAHAYREQARAALDDLDDRALAGALGACFYLGWAEYFLDRIDDALRHLRRGIAAARSSGQGSLLMPMQLTECAVLLVMGDLGAAEAICEGAVEAGRVSGNPQLLSWALGKQCLVKTHTGDLGAARRAGEEAITVARAYDSTTLAAGNAWAVAGVLVDDGDPGRAAALILDACGGPDLPVVFPAVRPYCWEILTRAAIAGGDLDQAAAWAARAADLAGDLGIDRRSGMALRAQAEALLAAGAPEGAAGAAAAAASAAGRSGARIDAARARVVEGRALAALGRRGDAVACLSAAEGDLRACGALRWADGAARELRLLGHRVARAPAASGVAGLSARELQIAELVSEGRRNREIAERLFLSQRTVEDALARIRAKLGVASRAAIGAALERERRR